MANQLASGDHGDDPLALFGVENEISRATVTNAAKDGLRRVGPSRSPERHDAEPAATAPSSAPELPTDGAGNVAYPTASVLQKMMGSVPEPVAASDDLSVEVLGPPAPEGSVSFDHVCAVKGLGFVEGVALIKTTCEALAAAGPSAGVPELHGLFLTGSGDVVLHGAPSGDPSPRELARLLHQLVAPDLMPPAGRLFVGRWINSDAKELSEFASELAYFARPNSRELLVALHGRCDGVVAHIRPARPRQQAAKKAQPKPEPKRPLTLAGWMQSHKPEVTAAVAVLAAATLTAIATLLWAPRTVEASREPSENVAPFVDENGDATDPSVTEASAPGLFGPPAASPPGGNPKTRASAPRVRSSAPTNRAPAVAPSARQRTAGGQAPAIRSQDAAIGVPLQGPIPLLPSRPTPDLKIYTSLDSGVEPPRLRSAEIPELLIAGFEKRTNRIELVISERGEVQQAKMIGPPQRMPDIMLISRAKELLFDPAIRNGVPVRYRLILSWNVTP